MSTPYAPGRILDPKEVLLGPGNPNALQNVIVDPLPDGALCYVRNVDDIYFLDKFSTVPSNPPNVVPTIKGASAPGRWVRYDATGYYRANWGITDWYIDYAEGNDLNSGTSEAQSLETGAELLRRLGPYALWPNSVTVHVGDGGMNDALVLQGAMLVPGNTLRIVGEILNVVQAGVVDSYSALNPATPAAAHLHTTLIANWTSYAGRRLRIVGGARAGSIAWVAIQNPGGLGVAIARTSNWCNLDTTSTVDLAQSITPANGDTVQIEGIPSVPAITIRVDGAIVDSFTNPLYPDVQIAIESLEVPYVEIDSTANASSNRCYFYGCNIETVREVQRAVGMPPGMRHIGCRISALDGASAVPVSGDMYNCFVHGPGYLNVYPGTFAFGRGTLFQGMGLQINSGASARFVELQIFDIVGANDAIYMAYNSSAEFTGSVSGNNNGGYGWNVENCTRLRLNTGITLNLSGTSGQVFLGSTPNLTITQAQLAAAGDDFTSAGQATFVTGAPNVVDVPVSYWDHAIQSLSHSRVDSGGTPGIITAPAANRTATGFRLQSSEATESSTVDWAISPLGRSIQVTQS